VLKHKLAEGGTVYTQYGHLEDVRVSPGRVVRRGDLVGHVLDQDAAGETHLHFEVRKFASWEEDDCAGPGYAPEGSTPKQHRWLDPVPFYYTHRPSHPAAVITWTDPDPLPMRARPRADAASLGSLTPSSRVSAIDVVKGEHCHSEKQCSDWWYELRVASGRRVFLSGFRKGEYGSALTVGEPRRTGAQWSPSSRRPLVDYGFDDPVAFAQGSVVNDAHPGRRDGRILGDAGLVDGKGGGDDKALRLDGETAYVEVEDSQQLRFRDGIEVEALVSRESASTGDAIASQGGLDGPWRLTLTRRNARFELASRTGSTRVSSTGFRLRRPGTLGPRGCTLRPARWDAPLLERQPGGEERRARQAARPRQGADPDRRRRGGTAPPRPHRRRAHPRAPPRAR
jgi:hypothetical protein